MPAMKKAKVFLNGRSQAVRIPAEYRFDADEIYVRRDEETGDLILSEHPPATVNWDRIYAALDQARFPEGFMAEREQGVDESREPL